MPKTAALSLAENFTLEEEVVMVPQTRKILVKKERGDSV